MHRSTAPSATVTREDLMTLAQVAELRLPLRAAESRRLERMRALLAAGTELGRALGAYTHCGLVNCQGSHGVGSLCNEGEAFLAAFVRYTALMREIADEYRPFTEDAPIPLAFAGLDPIGAPQPRLEVA